MTRKSTRASACALCAWSGGRDERHEHQHVQVLVLVLFVLGVGQDEWVRCGLQVMRRTYYHPWRL